MIMNFWHHIRAALIALSLVLVAACGDGNSEGGSSSRFLANKDSAFRGPSQTGTDSLRLALNGPAAERRYLGTDEFLAETRGRRQIVEVSDDGAITLNLVNVPIEQAAKAVLGDALNKNYTIKPGVEGMVTLQTTRPLSERALLETFEIVLGFNGAALQTSGDLITIVPLKGSSRHVTPLGQSQQVGARLIAVPLEFIGTTEMVRLLEPIVGDTVELMPIPNRNIILISGARDEMAAAIDAVNLFDVDVLKGKSVGLYRLKAAEPEAVVEEMNLIFETEDGGSLQNVVTFIPSKRLSAVIVVSTRSTYLAKAEQWIRDLDRTAGGARRRPAVYNLQHRIAKDLAPILGDMLQDIAQADEASGEGAPRVVADDAKNAIIVWGNDTEQESFSRLLQALDTVPVQVLLEATIVEVSLRDELNFGLRWFFEQGNFEGVFTDASNGGVAPTFPGLSLLFQTSSARVAINALASITDVNIISSPNLLVLDNQEARLQIGDEVPIATQQSQDVTNPDAPIINTIAYRDAGIILKVKPRVAQSGQVILDIDQEVSSVQNTTTSGIDSPTISQRRVETNVVVHDGQTIVLGGLIEDTRTRTDTKVPGAGDIPVLGALFRNREDNVGKRELLILITPKVVRNGQEAKSITDELRSRISGANGLLRKGIPSQSVGHRITD
ncbi:type II secretion system secretin GspD [Ruegeria sp.]|uniref:type II secretion system secretin GspD n=1 Tax=Ruegeria sp. TaxID=1879320 RepID=UPI0023158257|nr:type II secretion system secretin GspD [Ruegeria sp.]MDA7966149.1 type II secretion system secretin GspD [Ruegeria sp.]